MSEVGARVVFGIDELGRLLSALRDAGRELVGPTVRDGAIVLDRLRGVEDLPRGVGDEQAPGSYRLRERGDAARFGWAVGPRSPKRELLVPTKTLVRLRKSARGFDVEPPPPAPKLALVGVRACELAAIAVQDRTLLCGPHADADYARRRADLFVIAVSCGEPAATCFCTSMGTGPKVARGFDLALTELVEAGEPTYVCEVGTEAGARALEGLDARPASADDLARADAVVAAAAARMTRKMDAEGVPELLARNLEHPRWDDVAARCIGCANCTMVCPTCFCTDVVDQVSLDGEIAERVRVWDSCFTLPFSYVHGGSVRTSVRGRYRQWLVHKLSSWVEQFGTSGCVGCGRCITWCPVGIDLTEEVRAIREDDRGAGGPPPGGGE